MPPRPSTSWRNASIRAIEISGDASLPRRDVRIPTSFPTGRRRAARWPTRPHSTSPRCAARPRHRPPRPAHHAPRRHRAHHVPKALQRPAPPHLSRAPRRPPHHRHRHPPRAPWAVTASPSSAMPRRRISSSPSRCRIPASWGEPAMMSANACVRSNACCWHSTRRSLPSSRSQAKSASSSNTSAT